MSTVDLDRTGALATVNLRRPDKLNAINRDLARDLSHAFDVAEGDSGCGTIVLRGAGRAFCVGADLNAVARDDPDAHAAWIDEVGALHERIRRSPLPVVAAVHGYALGAGLSLALVADVVVCADDAILGLPEVEHGLVAGISTVYLRAAAGARVAADLALSGRRVTGTEAAALGLVSLAVPAAGLDAAVDTTASRLAIQRPGAQRLTKRLLSDTAGLALDLQLRAARDAVLLARRSKQARDAAEAFGRRERT